jgi:lincosamide nucleotidyltransferase A/C/D/E
MDADHGRMAGMASGAVMALVSWLEEAHVTYQVNGGWAVDALAGRQTRDHGDLDVFLDADKLQDAVDWLQSKGYEQVVQELPVRVELRRGEDAVDLHPMVLDSEGNGVQQGFGDAVFHHRSDRRTVGSIDGRGVVVAALDRLVELRAGYEPRPVDAHDLAVLIDLTGDSRSGRS